MPSFPTPTSSLPRPPCAADPERMFPTVESVRAGAPSAEERAALAVCAACPLVVPCRRWVLDVRLPHGVAGGLTVADRRGAGRSGRRSSPGHPSPGRAA